MLGGHGGVNADDRQNGERRSICAGRDRGRDVGGGARRGGRSGLAKAIGWRPLAAGGGSREKGAFARAERALQAAYRRAPLLARRRAPHPARWGALTTRHGDKKVVRTWRRRDSLRRADRRVRGAVARGARGARGAMSRWRRLAGLEGGVE